METYNYLVECEQKKMGGLSMLKVFCCFDIGLMVGDGGKLGYFVNEAEQMLMAGLWTKKVNVDYNVFAETFSKALLLWANTPLY